MKDYTKMTLCKCYNCHSLSMEKITIDYDEIKVELQLKYNEGFNEGYRKAKEEMREKLNL